MRRKVKVGCTLVCLLGVLVLLGSGRLIDAQEQTLPRAGLNVEILQANIPEATRRPEVTFRITDDRGTPLDKNGLLTEGVVQMRFIIARINPGERQYTAYTVRQQTGDVLGTVEQASNDFGGTLTQREAGIYTYSFGTELPVDFPRSATHTVAIYADRDLTHFDGNDYVGQASFDFVPDGSAVTDVRDVVSDAACNQCHNPLQAHGGFRRTVALCVLCHSPQTEDPDTGNSVDFKVMVHKIHRGADLPSVKAGTPFQIIGFRGHVADFSSVEFPRDVRNCQTCHQGASQSMNYLTKPSRAACGSCHDSVNFATGENHLGGPQFNDNLCQFCHAPTSSTEFDLSIAGAHVVPLKSRQLPGTNLQIVSVADTNPGENLEVVFNIKDDEGNTVLPGEMDFLRVTLAGPTTDYETWYSEDARSAMATGDGNFSLRFATPIPSDASGTFTVGLEGFRNITLNPGSDREQTVRDAGDNVTESFAVTGDLVPRRMVVDVNNCNSCHDRLMSHGGIRRNNVQYCILCHNPNQTDEGQRPEDQLPAETVDFKLMIHRIHSGENLENEYSVFGLGNVAHRFNEVRFPADRRDCTICHIDGTQLIGSTEGRLPTVNPRSFVDPTLPISTACIGCHDEKETLAHVSLNSASFGESCAVCHGEGRDFAVSRVHFRRPDAIDH